MSSESPAAIGLPFTLASMLHVQDCGHTRCSSEHIQILLFVAVTKSEASDSN